MFSCMIAHAPIYLSMILHSSCQICRLWTNTLECQLFRTSDSWNCKMLHETSSPNSMSRGFPQSNKCLSLLLNNHIWIDETVNSENEFIYIHSLNVIKYSKVPLRTLLCDSDDFTWKQRHVNRRIVSFILYITLSRKCNRNTQLKLPFYSY